MKTHKVLSLATVFALMLCHVSAVHGMEKEVKRSLPSKKKYNNASSSEDDTKSTSSASTQSNSSNEHSEEEKDLAKFFTVGEGAHPGIVAISGLRIGDDQKVYDFMIDKMSNNVDELIRKGWHGNHNKNQYKGFSFSHCTFNKELLVDVGNKLSRYKLSIDPSTHFYECDFEKARLRSTLKTTAGFSKNSSFLNYREGNQAIPNTNKK